LARAYSTIFDADFDRVPGIKRREP